MQGIAVRLSALVLAVLVALTLVAPLPAKAQMHQGGGREDWNSLSGMWGKRAASDWNRLSGMWGKRFGGPYEALRGPLGQAFWLRTGEDVSEGSHGIRARAAAAPTDNHWNGLSGYWG